MSEDPATMDDRRDAAAEMSAPSGSPETGEPTERTDGLDPAPVTAETGDPASAAAETPGPAPAPAEAPGSAPAPRIDPIDPARYVVPAKPLEPGRLLRIRLQLTDRPLVAAGQHVEAGQPVVERFREQEPAQLPTTAGIVGLPPGAVLDNVPVHATSRLGRRSDATTRRTRVIEHSRDGTTRLAAGSGDIVVHSPVAGVVETLLPGRMDIRSEGLAIGGQVAWGRPAAGRILIATDGPDAEMPASRIDIAATGTVLVVGARLDIEALSRARAIGVSAVVSGSIASRDLRQLAGSEQRQQAALHAAAPFAIIALGGYGRLPIPSYLWRLLVEAEGRPAGIMPDDRALVIGGDPEPLLASAQRPPGTVRVVAGERRDQEGVIVGLAGQRRWSDGSYAPGAFIEVPTSEGPMERVCVPLTMLERLG